MCADPSQISTESKVNWGAVWNTYRTSTNDNPISNIMRKCLNEQFGSSRKFKSQGGWGNTSTTKAFTAVMNNKANRDDLLDRLIKNSDKNELNLFINSNNDDLTFLIKERIEKQAEFYSGLNNDINQSSLRDLSNNEAKLSPELFVQQITKATDEEVVKLTDKNSNRDFENIFQTMKKSEHKETLKKYYDIIKIKFINYFNSVKLNEISNILKTHINYEVKHTETKYNNLNLTVMNFVALSALKDLSQLKNNDNTVQFEDKEYLTTDSAQMNDLCEKLKFSLLAIGVINPVISNFDNNLKLDNQKINYINQFSDFDKLAKNYTAIFEAFKNLPFEKYIPYLAINIVATADTHLAGVLEAGIGKNKYRLSALKRVISLSVKDNVINYGEKQYEITNETEVKELFINLQIDLVALGLLPASKVHFNK